MISPEFLNSATGTMALSVILFSCVFFGMDAFALKRVEAEAKRGTDSSEDVGSSEESEASEAEEGSEDVGSSEESKETSEAEEGSDEEDVGSSEEDVRDAAIALINLDPLRNAPPLPDSDDNE